jgi:hypothetical protein
VHVINVVSEYWPIADTPAEDGSELYLCIPPELARKVRTVRFPAPGRRRARVAA